MPDLKTDHRVATNAEHRSATESSAHTRIDSPHVAVSFDSKDPAPTNRDLALQVESAGQLAASQLRNQARQLAKHLRNKQHELDRREAHLHVQMAIIDDEIRTTRLWIREKTAAVTEREHELNEKEQALLQQTTAIAAAEANLERSAAEQNEQIATREKNAAAADGKLAEAETKLAEDRAKLEETQRQLKQRESALKVAELRHQDQRERATKELSSQQQRLQQCNLEWRKTHRKLIRNQERRRAALEDDFRTRTVKLQAEHVRQANQRQRDAEQSLHGLQVKQRQLDQQEILLNNQFVEVENLLRQLAAEEEKLKHEGARRRKLLDEHQNQHEREIQRQRQALKEQTAAVEKNRALAEQMRAEVATLHRESLEMRFSAEQLWSQLVGQVPPAELTRSLGEIRAKLAESYSLEQKAVAEQKGELAALVKKLDFQQQHLREQQQQMQMWFTRRSEEIEEQAARLVAREQQLDEQEQHFVNEQRRWAQERGKYQRQIRELLSQLRQVQLAG